MTLTSAPTAASGPAPAWWLQPLLLAGVFAAEILAISVSFNESALSRDPRVWAPWINQVPGLIGGVLTALAAFSLLVSPRFAAHRLAFVRARDSHRAGLPFAAHVGAMGVFAVCTWRLYETQGVWAGWAGIWVIAGASAVFLWLASLAPLRFWWDTAIRERISALIAAGLGYAALKSSQFTQDLWEPLASGTFWVSHKWLVLLYPDVTYESAGKVLGTPEFLVQIAPMCSGYEGMGLISLFLATYLYLFRRTLRFPHALMLVPIGLATIWLSNTVRIALLVAIGSSVSEELAIGAFHSKAGWVFFLAVSVGLIALSHKVAWFANSTEANLTRADRERVRGSVRTDEATGLMLPLLVLLASTIVLSAVTIGFDWGYPVKVLAVAAVLWYFRRVYQQYVWKVTWQSVAMGGLVFAVWLGLEPEQAGAGEVYENALGQESSILVGLWLAFRVLGSTLTVPLAEEFAFRGYLMRKLVSSRFESVRFDQFTWLSFIGSSVLFGAMHGRWLAGVLAGMAYALVVIRKGQLAEGVYAHMTTNTLIALYVLYFGQWSLWA